MQRTPREISPNAASTIDFVRWFSALLVLLYHVRLNLVVPYSAVPENSRTLFVKALYAIAGCGDLAVVCFFVVSGFLVGGAVVSDVAAGRFSARDYFINRFARIYTVLIPALAVGFFLDLIRIGQFGLSDGAGGETTNSYSSGTIVGNIVSLQAILVPTLGSNLPLWSLAFEVFYYIAFPALAVAAFMALRGRSKFPVILCVASLWLFGKITSGVVPMFAIWGLGVFARLMPAPIVRSQSLSWALTVLAFVVYPSVSLLSGMLAKGLVGLSVANLLLTAYYADSWFIVSRRALNSELAAFSYSLYLVHAPALHFVLSFAFDRRNPHLDRLPTDGGLLLIGVWLTLALVGHAFIFSLATEAKTATVKARLKSLLSVKKDGHGRASLRSWFCDLRD